MFAYAEVSGVTVSAKRILSLLSKGDGEGELSGKEQSCKDYEKWTGVVNSNKEYDIEGATEMAF